MYVGDSSIRFAEMRRNGFWSILLQLVDLQVKGKNLMAESVDPAFSIVDSSDQDHYRAQPWSCGQYLCN